MSDSFCGKIDKKVLSDTVSDEDLTDVLSGIMFMDAWEYIDEIRELTNGYLKDLDFSSDEVLDKFISDNSIRIKEEYDAMNIGFALDSNRIMSEITGEEVEKIAPIYGSVMLDKNTGDVLHFEYDLSGCLFAMLTESGQDKEYNKVNAGEFVVEGKIFGKPLEDISLDKEFTEYTEDEKYDFINEFSEHFIPLYEREG